LKHQLCCSFEYFTDRNIGLICYSIPAVTTSLSLRSKNALNFGSGLIENLRMSYFQNIEAGINPKLSGSKHRLKASGDPIVLPFAILDFLLMCIGFMFLGVYSLSLPVS